MGSDPDSADVVLRELREADAESVADLFRGVYGESRSIDAAEVTSWLGNKELNPAWLRVLEEGGRIVGYADLQLIGDEVALDIAAPTHWATFCDWAEAEAQAAGARRVRIFLPAGHAIEPSLEQRGYRMWRSSYTMEAALDEAPPEAPGLPPPFQPRTYRPQDEEPLRGALNDAFACDPFHHEVTQTSFRETYLGGRGFDPLLWLLAWDAHEVAGFLLASPERPGDPGLAWIQALGVRPPWRRRGIGEGLLRTALHELHARGVRRVGLGVDGENGDALRLYRRLGMAVVRQGNNWTLDM